MFIRRSQPTWLSEADLAALERASKRCSRLSTSQLLNWAEQALNGMGKGFDDFRDHGEQSSVEDIRLGLLSMLAVVTELSAQGR